MADGIAHSQRLRAATEGTSDVSNDLVEGNETIGQEGLEAIVEEPEEEEGLEEAISGTDDAWVDEGPDVDVSASSENFAAGLSQGLDAGQDPRDSPRAEGEATHDVVMRGDSEAAEEDAFGANIAAELLLQANTDAEDGLDRSNVEVIPSTLSSNVPGFEIDVDSAFQQSVLPAASDEPATGVFHGKRAASSLTAFHHPKTAARSMATRWRSQTGTKAGAAKTAPKTVKAVAAAAVLKAKASSKVLASSVAVFGRSKAAAQSVGARWRRQAGPAVTMPGASRQQSGSSLGDSPLRIPREQFVRSRSLPSHDVCLLPTPDVCSLLPIRQAARSQRVPSPRSRPASSPDDDDDDLRISISDFGYEYEDIRVVSNRVDGFVTGRSLSDERHETSPNTGPQPHHGELMSLRNDMSESSFA